GEELNHLPDGYGIVLHIEGRSLACAIKDIAENANEIDSVCSDFWLGGCVIFEFTHAGVSPSGGFQHLFLLKHLSRILEPLVLEEALDELAARILGGIVRPGRSAGKQHLALDVNEERRYVDEFA